MKYDIFGTNVRNNSASFDKIKAETTIFLTWITVKILQKISLQISSWNVHQNFKISNWILHFKAWKWEMVCMLAFSLHKSAER